MAQKKSQKRMRPDRSKIATQEDHAVKSWAKHLNVTREDLRRAVDKVGNSAASVRKELKNRVPPMPRERRIRDREM
jgi:Protein of unknown function (DUF3606)